MKKSCANSHKGFVSLYFLGILLYLSALSAVIVENDISRMQTMENMLEDAECFDQERKTIQKFKCLLQQSSLEDREQDQQSEFEIDGSTAYIDIGGNYPELLTIYFDAETKHIIDYESIRYQ